MKKLILTAAIVLSMGIGAFAQQGDGLLLRSERNNDRLTTPSIPALPANFNEQDDQNGPLGSGIAVLVGLGAAYMVAKKRKED